MLQMHDYGFFQYEQFENFMIHASSQTVDANLDVEIRRSDLFNVQ